MAIRNVNPHGLAWPDHWFQKKPDKRTWEEKLAEFSAEMAKLMKAFEQRPNKSERENANRRRKQ